MTHIQDHDLIVGAEAIRLLVGISKVTVRKLGADPQSGIPMAKVDGRWQGSRRELAAWAKPEERLVGLERISAFIGCAPLTLINWHRSGDTGVPVRWVGGRVWAMKSELAAWMGSGDRITGAPAIAAELGIEAWVLRYRLKKADHGLPISRVGGRLWARRADLDALKATGEREQCAR